MKKIKNKKMLYIILTCIIVLLIGGLAIFEVVTKEEKEKIASIILEKINK